MVDELERHVPRMLKAQDAPPGFWTWFAGEAASIGSNARSKADWLHVRDRLSAMVEGVDNDAGKPPSRPDDYRGPPGAGDSSTQQAKTSR